MARDLNTSQLAAALHIDPQTVRYHARKGAIPHDRTPGGHRRFDLAEVRVALTTNGAAAPAHGHGGPLELDFGLDLGTPPSGELTASARTMTSSTAGYDEALLESDPPLPTHNFIDAFAVPGTARYPHSPPVVGTGR